MINKLIVSIPSFPSKTIKVLESDLILTEQHSRLTCYWVNLFVVYWNRFLQTAKEATEDRSPRVELAGQYVAAETIHHWHLRSF